LSKQKARISQTALDVLLRRGAPAKIHCGGGTGLRLDEGRYWTVRVGGHDISLGTYGPKFRLAEAQREAEDARKLGWSSYESPRKRRQAADAAAVEERSQTWGVAAKAALETF